MKNTVMWALIALNTVLLASLVGRSHSQNAAMAQARAPGGPYLTCPGEIVGGGRGGAVVYIFDTRNYLLTAAQQTNTGVDVMPPVDLSQHFALRR